MSKPPPSEPPPPHTGRQVPIMSSPSPAINIPGNTAVPVHHSPTTPRASGAWGRAPSLSTPRTPVFPQVSTETFYTPINQPLFLDEDHLLSREASTDIHLDEAVEEEEGWDAEDTVSGRTRERFSDEEEEEEEEEEEYDEEGMYSTEPDYLSEFGAKEPRVGRRDPLDYFRYDDFAHEFNLSFGTTPPLSSLLRNNRMNLRHASDLGAQNLTRGTGAGSTRASKKVAKAKGGPIQRSGSAGEIKAPRVDNSRLKQGHQSDADHKRSKMEESIHTATSVTMSTGRQLSAPEPAQHRTLDTISIASGGPLSREYVNASAFEYASSSTVVVPLPHAHPVVPGASPLADLEKLQNAIRGMCRRRTQSSMNAASGGVDVFLTAREPEGSSRILHVHEHEKDIAACEGCKAQRTQLWQLIREECGRRWALILQPEKRYFPLPDNTAVTNPPEFKRRVMAFRQKVQAFSASFKSSSYTHTGHEERMSVLAHVDALLDQWEEICACLPSSKRIDPLLEDRDERIAFAENFSSLQTWSKVTRHFLSATERLNEAYNIQAYDGACRMWETKVMRVAHSRSTGEFKFEDDKHSYSSGSELARGTRTLFFINSPGHPLLFQGDDGKPCEFAINNSRSVGYIQLNVPHNCPDRITFRCGNDAHTNCKSGVFHVKRNPHHRSGEDTAFKSLTENIILKEHAVRDTLQAIETIAWGACQLLLDPAQAKAAAASSALAHVFPGKVGKWMDDATDQRARAAIGIRRLPSWLPVYLYTAFIPLGVMTTVLRQIGELFGNSDPASIQTAEFWLDIYRDVLREAIRVKAGFVTLYSAVDDVSELADTPFLHWLNFSIDWFDRRLNTTFNAFLRLTECHFKLATHGLGLPKPETNIATTLSLGQKDAGSDVSFDLTEIVNHFLNREWERAKDIAAHIDRGEELVTSTFCGLATHVFQLCMYSLGRVKGAGESSSGDSHVLKLRNDLISIKRTAIKVLGFARQLRREVEVAAEFRAGGAMDSVVAAMLESGHKQIILPNADSDTSGVFENVLVFCPKKYATENCEKLLLDFLCQSLSWSPDKDRHAQHRADTRAPDDLYLVLVPNTAPASAPLSRQASEDHRKLPRQASSSGSIGNAGGEDEERSTLGVVSASAKGRKQSAGVSAPSSTPAATATPRSVGSGSTRGGGGGATSAASARTERAFSFSEQSQDEARSSWRMMHGRSPFVTSSLLSKAMDSLVGQQRQSHGHGQGQGHGARQPSTAVGRTSSNTSTASGGTSAVGEETVKLVVVASSSRLLPSLRERFLRTFATQDIVRLHSTESASTSWKSSIAENLTRFRVQSEKCAQAIVKMIESLIAKLKAIFFPANVTSTMRHAFELAFEYLPELLRYNATPSVRMCVLDVALLWCNYICDIAEPDWTKRGFEFIVDAMDIQNLRLLTPEGCKVLDKASRACVEHVKSTSRSRKASTVAASSGIHLLNGGGSSGVGGSEDADAIRGRLGSCPDSSREESRAESDESDEDSPHNTSGAGSGVGAQRGGQAAFPPKLSCVQVDDMMASGRSVSVFCRSRNFRPRVGHVVVPAEEPPAPPKQEEGTSVPFSWTRGRRLGVGAFGCVYLVMGSNREVMAMKEVPWRTSDAAQAMRREWLAVTGVSSPHLVKYIAIDYRQDKALVFMTYCSGGTLFQHAMSNELTMDVVKNFTCQILAGLKVLHDAKLVHRDLKGDNIFLDRNQVIKIGDFGCCVRSEAVGTPLVGTIPYSAPEVLIGGAPPPPNETAAEKERRETKVRFARDVWAVGAVMVEMISGERPFYGKFQDQMQIMGFYLAASRARTVIEPHPDIPERADVDCRAFIKRCFTFDPVARPTVDELLDDPFLCRTIGPGRCPCGCS